MTLPTAIDVCAQPLGDVISPLLHQCQLLFQPCWNVTTYELCVAFVALAVQLIEPNAKCQPAARPVLGNHDNDEWKDDECSANNKQRRRKERPSDSDKEKEAADTMAVPALLDGIWRAGRERVMQYEE